VSVRVRAVVPCDFDTTRKSLTQKRVVSVTHKKANAKYFIVVRASRGNRNHGLSNLFRNQQRHWPRRGFVRPWRVRKVCWPAVPGGCRWEIAAEFIPTLGKCPLCRQFLLYGDLKYVDTLEDAFPGDPPDDMLLDAVYVGNPMGIGWSSIHLFEPT
jgi:hypothetical protein